VREKIRFALIGAGLIGPSHAESIAMVEGAELAAVADIDAGKGTAFAARYGAEFYTDYREMLRRDDIDAVSIATPSSLHCEAAVAAAEAGKHIACEKPIDITIEKADRILRAAEEHRVLLTVFFQRRFYAPYIAARDAVRDGRLGRIVASDLCVKFFRSQEYYDQAAWRGTWEHDGGGCLMNQGVHGVDLMLWIMGDVERVYAKTMTVSRKIDVEDLAFAILKFKSGAHGVLQGATLANPGEALKLHIHGERGTIVVHDDGFDEWAETDTDDEAAPRLDAAALSKKYGREHGVPLHYQQMKDFVQAIQNGTEPAITGRSARKPLELILAMYESSKTGKEITL